MLSQVFIWPASLACNLFVCVKVGDFELILDESAMSLACDVREVDGALTIRLE